ncbi:MAG: hypothetical protein AAGE85_12895 [Pseudomonadota bacterium]
MAKQDRFTEQIRRNAVALISLAVAVSSLGYNTWRNEKSEYNRNQRQASFELLLKVNELRQLVLHRHYQMDFEDRGNLKTGWALVLTVEDLAEVLDQPLPAAADKLKAVWQSNSEQLGARTAAGELDDGAVEEIMLGIDRVRGASLELLESLD